MRPMEIPRFNTLGQYHDAWANIILFAPDDFRSFSADDKPMDQRAELDRCFQELRDGFHFAEKRLKDQRLRRICRELLEMSYEAYVAGDGKLGSHIFQECEGLIWPSRLGRIKHAVEAERRAFGEVKHFADVKVSPYPYEGTRADLGQIQEKLWDHAKKACEPRLLEEAGFMMVWVMQADGSIIDAKQSSQKKSREFIKEGARTKRFIGAASAQLLPGGGLLACHLEEPGKPFIAVMNLRQDGIFQEPRFHLNDPVTFAATGE